MIGSVREGRSVNESPQVAMSRKQRFQLSLRGRKECFERPEIVETVSESLLVKRSAEVKKRKQRKCVFFSLGLTPYVRLLRLGADLADAIHHFGFCFLRFCQRSPCLGVHLTEWSAEYTGD
jgi:hypothetical protein